MHVTNRSVSFDETLLNKLVGDVNLDSESCPSDDETGSGSSSDESYDSLHGKPRRYNVNESGYHTPTGSTGEADEADEDSDRPGGDLVRQLGHYSPLLNLRQFLTDGTRATALFTQREQLLLQVAEFCTDQGCAESSAAAMQRTTPINSPDRRRGGTPRSDTKAKKPNRRAARRRASA